MKLIVETEMPKIPQFCGECKFHKPLYHTQYCVLEGRNCAPWKTRKDWCPIKGVLPDEHGDLVDADTVLWEVPDSEGIVPPMPVTVGDVIEGYDVQIVIAAERKDDE